MSIYPIGGKLDVLPGLCSAVVAIYVTHEGQVLLMFALVHQHFLIAVLGWLNAKLRYLVYHCEVRPAAQLIVILIVHFVTIRLLIIGD